jgi:hypothetical protein
MAGFVAEPRCHTCAKVATRVELLPPRERPIEWAEWDADLQAVFERYRDPSRWRLLFRGIEAGNGLGNDIADDGAGLITAAFEEPYRYARVHTAGLYDDAGFCEACDAAYCHRHWNVRIGYGHCPKGHGKSLDPHWHP